MANAALDPKKPKWCTECLTHAPAGVWKHAVVKGLCWAHYARVRRGSKLMPSESYGTGAGRLERHEVYLPADLSKLIQDAATKHGVSFSRELRRVLTGLIKAGGR